MDWPYIYNVIFYDIPISGIEKQSDMVKIIILNYILPMLIFGVLLLYGISKLIINHQYVLNKISTNQINFVESWNNGINKISKFKKTDKFFTFFWLLGPFIFLIERDPADLWISSFALIFLFKCYKNNHWSWITNSWFKFALIFWVICIISSINSPYFSHSIKDAIFWIRFPLYAVAAQFWIGKDKDVRIMMYFSVLIGSLILSSFLFFEVLVVPKPRLTFPYGDVIPGTYFARISLPVILSITFLTLTSKKNKVVLFGSILSIIILALILTGERINLLIVICSINLFLLFYLKNLKKIVIFLLVECIFVSFFLFNRLENNSRKDLFFYKNIPLINQSNDNPYWGVWRSGIQQITVTPILGIGPGATRYNCKNLPSNTPKWLPGKNHCNNHPHNFYIQIFAETGIFGFLIGCLLFFKIFSNCYNQKKFLTSPITLASFIIPIAFFFPIQQFGNFFGQWGNLFIWFGLGLALASSAKKPTN